MRERIASFLSVFAKGDPAPVGCMSPGRLNMTAISSRNDIMQHEFSMPRVKKASSKYKEFIMPRKKSYAMRSAKPALLRQGCSASFLIEGHAGSSIVGHGRIGSRDPIPLKRDLHQGTIPFPWGE